MTKKVNKLLSALMSIGYGARGLVYVLVGAIALYAAVSGAQAEGSSAAFQTLSNQPFGRFLLALVGLGIFAYVAWRLVDAIMDLEDEGDDTEGYFSRAGQAMSGLTHAVLAVTALSIAINDGGGSQGGTESFVASVMAQPLGRFAVGLAALTTLAVAVYLFWKSFTASYREQFRRSKTTERLDPLIRFGLAAHGFVLLIVGGLLAYAAITTDAESAAGMGEALRILENQAYGQVLLSLAGIGMLGFAAYCFTRARYGNSPGLERGSIGAA